MELLIDNEKLLTNNQSQNDIEQIDLSNACELCCSHCFHPNCIKDWLIKNTSCPICREDCKFWNNELKQFEQNNLSYSSHERLFEYEQSFEYEQPFEYELQNSFLRYEQMSSNNLSFLPIRIAHTNYYENLPNSITHLYCNESNQVRSIENNLISSRYLDLHAIENNLGRPITYLDLNAFENNSMRLFERLEFNLST